MKVTVCELDEDPSKFVGDWKRLVSHVGETSSDFVLLPEMPFYSWFCDVSEFNLAVWGEAVSAHDRWDSNLKELSAKIVTGSRPIVRDGHRLNEGFVWDRANGTRGIHAKSCLPNESGFWEASWYERGPPSFGPTEAGGVRMGFLICSELWAMKRANEYGSVGVQMLLVPRATEKTTSDKWLAGGRAAAIVSGAFCLSSNRVGRRGAVDFGGLGWVISPDGDVLGVTTRKNPFVTVTIHSDDADGAKQTFPRYMLKQDQQ